MYTAISAIGIEFGLNQKWKEIDLSLFSVQELFSTFKDAQFKLTNSLLPSEVYLRLDKLRTQYATYTGKLHGLLDTITTALDTEDKPLIIKSFSAQYRDAVAAGYTLTPVTHSNTVLASNHFDEVTDLRLTRKSKEINYQSFFEHCLVSINGFYHLCDTDGINGVIVSDAMKSVKLSGCNQVGLYSFKHVCKLQTVPLKSDMLFMEDARFVTIAFTQDLSNKQLLLSIGGYLQYVDGKALIKVSDSAFRIDIAKLPLLDRFYESRQYLDLSSLPTENTPQNDSQIGSSDVQSEEYILAYLTLSQSFAVILDTESIYVDQHFVRPTRMTDTYVAYKKPYFPLVTQWGRHPEYWVRKDDDHYAMTTVNCVRANRLYDTLPYEEYLSVADSNQPQNRFTPSPAHLLEIGKETI